jgi:hypothetical protein
MVAADTKSGAETMPSFDVNTLTFGVEIECGIPYESMTANGWRVGGYRAGASMAGVDGWKIQSDGSVSFTDGRASAEVVSGVLQGEEGIASVRQCVLALRRANARVNMSCGLHVHVGFPWEGEEGAAILKRLIFLVANFEKALYASTGTHSREQASWCRTIKQAYRQYSDLRTIDQVVNAHHARYHTLNLTNLQHVRSRRTVEFRVFAGTCNLVKIESAISMALALVHRAVEGKHLVDFDAVTAECDKKKFDDTRIGRRELERFINRMNWCRKNRTRYGLIATMNVTMMTEMMRRLADKYDGYVAPPTAPRGRSAMVDEVLQSEPTTREGNVYTS